MGPTPEAVVPAYDGPCISSVVPALLDGGSRAGGASGSGAVPAWLPSTVSGAAQVVLLVLDGVGWEQLQERPSLAPTLSAMEGGPITSVAPSTTATALTSIATGSTPAEHGILGYRIAVGHGEVLNVLRWTTDAGDARQTVPPTDFMRLPAFLGSRPPIVTKSYFTSTGFTQAHLSSPRIVGWRLPSTIPVEVGRLLSEGERFVYAYYDGVDHVAHAHGFGPHYDAELRAADRLVADVLHTLPPDAVLVVTADHGQVQVGNALLTIDDSLLRELDLMSGEARFRWLHVREPSERRVADVAARARELYGHIAWVHTRSELEALGWYGGPLPAELAERVGDVALVPFAPVAFLDPADTGETVLVCRHGSLTPAEAWVPLLAARR